MEYLDYSNQAAMQSGFEHAREHHEAPQMHYHQAATAVPDQSKPAYYLNGLPPPVSCDIKPRLTKEQHDVLEAHYQKQQKPNTNTKKGFADTLGVSLDKVNNWFQNRRAKSKQDQKKRDSSVNLFNSNSVNHLHPTSNSEPLPAFTTAEYYATMPQWPGEHRASNELGIQRSQEQGHVHPGAQYHGPVGPDQYQGYVTSQDVHQDMFDSPEEVNRRTMTQDQFNAIARNGGFMHASGAYGTYPTDFSGNQEVFHQVFPEMDAHMLKQQEVFAFPHPVGAPLPSDDSTLASSISEQSYVPFPSHNTMQHAASASASSSEWGESRSSSLTDAHLDAHLAQMQTPYQQAPVAAGQWQPGQSVPVDFNQLNDEFRQVAQAAHQSRHLDQQPSPQEQPVAWLSDESYARRNSTSSTAHLTQSMSNVELTTPQPPQQATFKTPTPMSTIAARRQRKPAPIPLGALRSQSYSGVAPDSSPGQISTQHSPALAPQLRRIRSSNVVAGGVAQGRVMKSVPGSAQRSPLNWTFADAVANSPSIGRHFSGQQSQNSLAPPTPLTPGEYPVQDPLAQYSRWQSALHQTVREPSITESEVEQGLSLPLATEVPPQIFSSPPHTPSQFPQRFVQRLSNNAIVENTPPQSAPAAQQTFPNNVFALPAQPHPQLQQQAQAQPQHQYFNVIVPESTQPSPQQEQQPSVTFATMQHANVISSGCPPPGMPYQFANGVPVVNAEGNITMAFPAQLQFLPHSPNEQAALQQQQTPPQQQLQYSFLPPTTTTSSSSPAESGASPPGSVTSAVGSSTLSPPSTNSSSSSAPTKTSSTATAPPATTDFFIHEYSPPGDLKPSLLASSNHANRNKNTAVPSAASASSSSSSTSSVVGSSNGHSAAATSATHGPKNYSFSNSGPEHFVAREGKKLQQQQQQQQQQATGGSPATALEAS